jgi:hypothetical protein
MDSSIRDYLRRQGISDTALDKLERGEVPDDGALRKRTDDSPLEQVRKWNDLLHKINEGLKRIEESDVLREIQERVARIDKGKMPDPPAHSLH